MSIVDSPAANETIYSRMGRLLVLNIASEADTVRIAAQGISNRSYVRVANKLRLGASSVAAASTLRRRLATKARLTQVESERVLRLTRVYSEAMQLFGDEKAALEWLGTPADYLHNDFPLTPLQLAESDPGARLVESHIRRTAYGFL